MNSVIRILAVVVCTALTAPTWAQSDATNGNETQVLPERKTTLPERLAFCKKFYELNDGEVEQLRTALEAKLLLHRNYMRDHQTDLRRRTAAIAVALPQQNTANYSPEQKERFRSYYQEQIYRIYEAAPMSLSYAVQQAQEIVGKDRADRGREKIAMFFKPIIGDGPVDVKRMDRLVLKPVQMEDISMNDDLTSAQAKLLGGDVPRPVQRDPKKRPQPMTDGATEPASQSKTPARNPAPPEVPANLRNQPAAEAPALDQWEATYQTWATNYGFSPEQKATAERIYQYSYRKALEYVSENKDAIEASQGKDSNSTNELMKPVSKLFNQMKDRVDNVATLEQRARWAQQQKNKQTKE